MVKDFLKQESKFVQKLMKAKTSMSCEMIATHFIEQLKEYCNQDRSIKIEVTEDGESGAIVSYEAKK